MARVPGAELDLDGMLQLWRFNGGTQPDDAYLSTGCWTPRPGRTRARRCSARSTSGPRSPPAQDTRRPPSARRSTTRPRSPRTSCTGRCPRSTRARPPPRSTWRPAVTRSRSGPVPPRCWRRGSTRRATGCCWRTRPSSKVDGKAVSRRPALSVPVPAGREILAVRAGTRTVSLDGARRAAAPVAAADRSGHRSHAARRGRTAGDVSGYAPGLRLQQLRAAALGRAGRSAGGHRQRRRAAPSGSPPPTTPPAPGSWSATQGRARSTGSGCSTGMCPAPGRRSVCGSPARPAASWPPGRCSTRTGPPTSGVVTMDGARQRAAGHPARRRRRCGSRPKTVAEYRGLRVDALEPVATRTVWPPAVPEVTVDAHRREARAARRRRPGRLGAGALRTARGLLPLRRRDRRAGRPGVAERRSARTARPRTPSRRSATSPASVPRPATSAPPRCTSCPWRRAAWPCADPKFCLYLRGPDLCRTMPTVAQYQGLDLVRGCCFPPDPDGRGDPALPVRAARPRGQQQSQVEYRGRAAASGRDHPRRSSWCARTNRRAPSDGRTGSRHNPAQFSGDGHRRRADHRRAGRERRPGLARSPASQGAQKVTLQGWMSGWSLPPAAT